jgi:hypothetical protein
MKMQYYCVRCLKDIEAWGLCATCEIRHKSKGMLFSSPMVLAIMEGRKTMTRRIIAKQEIVNENVVRFDFPGKSWMQISHEYVSEPFLGAIDYAPHKIGDIIYARETWTETCDEFGLPIIVFKADNKAFYIGKDNEVLSECPARFSIENYPAFGKWKPSLFMLKNYARTFLRVTGVKAERLQSINQIDAIKEGFNSKEELIELWGKLNGKESWDQNPYVWAYEFEKLTYK